jgi:LemA protein
VKALIGVLVILAAVGLLAGRKYVAVKSELATEKAQIARAWSDIDDDMHRRADVIPSLAETLKSSAKDDGGLVKTVIDARAAMMGAQSPEQKFEAYKQMDNALGKAMAMAENNPSLTASGKFKSLKSQLQESENVILEERQRYNEAIQKYNKELSLFPTNVVAYLAGFSREKAYFKTDVNTTTF